MLREELAKALPQLAAPWLTPEQAEEPLADLREDTSRWLRDRNERLAVAVKQTFNEMAARGLLDSGAHLAALAGLKRDALHEYRDEMSLKRRQYRRIRDQAPTVDRYQLNAAQT